MKTNTLKTLAAAVSLMAGMASSFTAEAVSGISLLGSNPSAVDVWKFNCPEGTQQTRIKVYDNPLVNSPETQIIATAGMPGQPTFSAQTTAEGRSSPWVKDPWGAGTYALTVRKTTVNDEDYAIFIECLNPQGKWISPDFLVLSIDQ